MRFVTIIAVLFFSVIPHESKAQDGGTHDVTISNNLQYGTGGLQGVADIVEGMGKMNYTIPLFEITSHGVTMPITLTYDGSGIRVDDKNAEFGTNWSLNLPGRIDRMTNGLPDELLGPTGTWAESISYQQSIEFPFLSGSPHETFAAGYWWLGTMPSVFADQFLKQSISAVEFFEWEHPESIVEVSYHNNLASGQVDMKPDYFSMNTFLSSGMFTSGFPTDVPSASPMQFIDLYGTTVQIDASMDGNNIGGFSVKDVHGNHYEFQETEEGIYTDLFGLSNISFNSAWLLTSVTNSNGLEAFSFEYADEHYEVEIESRSGAATRSHRFNGVFSHNFNSTVNPNHTYRNKKKELELIEFENGRIVIERWNDASYEVPNVPGQYPVRSMTFYDSRNDQIQKVSFDYEIKFNSAINEGRLLLKDICIENNSESGCVSWKEFEYFGASESDAVTFFPKPGDLRQDYWGFFNQLSSPLTGDPFAVSAVHLTGHPIHRPSAVAHLNQTDNLKTMRLFDRCKTNRNPVLNHTRVGTLSKVINSEGSIQEFEYELHDYSFIEDTLTEVIPGKYITEVLEPGTDNCCSCIIQLPSDISEPQWVELTFMQGQCDTESGRLRPYESHYTAVTVNGLKIDEGLDNSMWVFLMPGVNYTFKLDDNGEPRDINPEEPPPAFIKPRLLMKYRKTDASSAESFRRDAGGLRLKSVTTDDMNGSRMKTKYIYDLAENPQKSSGILDVQPDALHEPYQIWEGGLKVVYRHSSELNAMNAGNVYYRNVESRTCRTSASICEEGSSSEHEIGRQVQYWTCYICPDTELRVTSKPQNTLTSWQRPEEFTAKNLSRKP